MLPLLVREQQRQKNRPGSTAAPSKPAPAEAKQPAAAAQKPAKAAKPAKPATPAKRTADKEAPAAEATVRVDTKRLDDIMNMVGELVLVRNRLVRLGP